MKKYLIALMILATVADGTSSFAQTKAKHAKKTMGPCGVTPVRHHKAVAKHKAKKPMAPVAMSQETITVDSHSPTSVVDINKGNVYVNDSLVTRVVNPLHEDKRIIINYIAPAAPPVTIERSETKNYTGKMPMLGVYIYSCCDNEAMVDGIIPCSPADKAGIFPGDVITSFNDQKVYSSGDLVKAISSANAGEEVPITYVHRDEVRHTEVLLSDKDKIAKSHCGCGDRDREWHQPPSMCNTCSWRRHRNW
jgi:predicted metalloprotease with PDZ domain